MEIIPLLKRILEELSLGGGQYQHSILGYLQSTPHAPFSRELKHVLDPDTPASQKQEILLRCIERSRKNLLQRSSVGVR